MNQPSRTWLKSPTSASQSNCVELANGRDGIRDSKNPDVVLHVRVEPLLAVIKAGLLTAFVSGKRR